MNRGTEVWIGNKILQEIYSNIGIDLSNNGGWVPKYHIVHAFQLALTLIEEKE